MICTIQLYFGVVICLLDPDDVVEYWQKDDEQLEDDLCIPPVCEENEIRLDSDQTSVVWWIVLLQ